MLMDSPSWYQAKTYIMDEGVFSDNVAGGTNTFSDSTFVSSAGSISGLGSNTNFGAAVLLDGSFTNTLGTGAHIFSGSFIVGSSGSFIPSTGTFTFNGLVQNDGGFTMGASSNTTFNANINVNANMFVNSTTTTMANVGAMVIVDGGGSLDIGGSLTINNSVTNQLNGSNRFVVSGTSLTGTGTLINDAFANLQIVPNTIGLAAVDFTATDNTVDYVASGAQSILDVTYYNLSTSGSGTKDLLDDVQVDGDLTIGSGTTFDDNGLVIDLSGDFVNNGNFTMSGILSFVGTATQSITDNAGINPIFEDIDINNTNGVVVQDNITINGQLTLTDGVFQCKWK